MKTPREILLGRHRSVESKLDAIRQKVLARSRRREGADLAVYGEIRLLASAATRLTWRGAIRSLRWHLAGMSAVWLCIAFLRLNVGQSTSLAAAIPRTKIPPPQIILASLRESRRQLLELVGARDADVPRPIPTGPRSERRDETLMA